MDNNKITNLTTPTAASEAANKSYVDSAASAAQSAATAVGNAAQTTANAAQTTANAAKTTADALVVSTTARSATASAISLYPADGNAATIITNAATRMTVTTAGNVGIGTTSPSAMLDVNGQGNILTGLTIGTTTNSSVISKSLGEKLTIFHATDARIYISHGTSAGLLIGHSTISSFISHRPASTDFWLICEQNVSMRFCTSNLTRMMITGNGNVGIGTDNPSYKLHVIGGSIQQDGAYALRVGKWRIQDEVNNGNAIVIYSDNGGGAYMVANQNYWRDPSDRRLKENIIYLTNCIDIIKKLKPCNYNFILDVSKNIQSGFIAQEIQQVLPHIVSSTKPTDSNIHLCPDEVLGIGMPILIPYIVGSIQEVDRQQQADKSRIAELENQVSNLEAKVSAQQSLINDILERLNALERG